MEQEEMSMYQGPPYFGDDASRYHGWYGYEPYGWYDYGYPYWYGHGWGHGWGHYGGDHHGWGHHGGGHHGGHRDDEENESQDYWDMLRRMPMPCPMPMPMPIQPIQPMPMQPIIQPSEKKYNEIKSLEKNVNITEINNTIIKIEQKHPYIIKRLLMLGLAYGECKKLIYLTLLCSGKFDL